MAFELHDKTALNFGLAELELVVMFGVKPPVKSGKIMSPPDLDNLVKFVQDSPEKTVYDNDAQITKYIPIGKRYDGMHGGEGYIKLSITKQL
jgi:Holliday junction resolvase RusA-like endonuclease